MRIRESVIPGIAGTSGMTLFSYLLSKKKQKNFKEPQLLKKLLVRTGHNRSTASVIAWTVHYLIGILFSSIIRQLCKNYGLKADLKNGVLMGGVFGLTGIIGWQATLKIHPFPPKIKKPQFFFQLLIAHVIFGVIATRTYKVIQQKRSGD
jgi:hypothetical protein